MKLKQILYSKLKATKWGQQIKEEGWKEAIDAMEDSLVILDGKRATLRGNKFVLGKGKKKNAVYVRAARATIRDCHFTG